MEDDEWKKLKSWIKKHMGRGGRAEITDFGYILRKMREIEGSKKETRRCEICDEFFDVGGIKVEGKYICSDCVKKICFGDEVKIL